MAAQDGLSLTRSEILKTFFLVTSYKNEPRCEKAGLRGFRPGPTQTGLYSHRRWLEAYAKSRFSQNEAHMIDRIALLGLKFSSQVNHTALCQDNE